MFQIEMFTLKLDSVLQPLYDSFVSFYHSKYPSRKLYLNSGHSGCLVLYRYNKSSTQSSEKSRVLLQCTTLQYCILSLFNQINSIAIDELKSICDNSSILLQTCDNLVAHDIIKKTEIGYELNTSFSSNKNLINITKIIKPTAHMKVMEINEDILLRRRTQLECVIVKMMKRQRTKQITHLINESVVEVSKTFTPSSGFVRDVIERLIQKEYLKRNKDNQEIIEYIA